ncbi:hypothetical protein INT45_003300 [Circinella minor]|uniref:Uncharacterized protein n=1 Tax=Circinella minor TaxID=1195481 RepID=A0A8H7SCL7_9FUNG|nr:hypothetical protein INT45_003300 [Circinella minor]
MAMLTVVFFHLCMLHSQDKMSLSRSNALICACGTGKISRNYTVYIHNMSEGFDKISTDEGADAHISKLLDEGR